MLDLQRTLRRMLAETSEWISRRAGGSRFDGHQDTIDAVDHTIPRDNVHMKQLCSVDRQLHGVVNSKFRAIYRRRFAKLAQFAKHYFSGDDVVSEDIRQDSLVLSSYQTVKSLWCQVSKRYVDWREDGERFTPSKTLFQRGPLQQTREGLKNPGPDCRV